MSKAAAASVPDPRAPRPGFIVRTPARHVRADDVIRVFHFDFSGTRIDEYTDARVIGTSRENGVIRLMTEAFPIPVLVRADSNVVVVEAVREATWTCTGCQNDETQELGLWQLADRPEQFGEVVIDLTDTKMRGRCSSCPSVGQSPGAERLADYDLSDDIDGGAS